MQNTSDLAAGSQTSGLRTAVISLNTLKDAEHENEGKALGSEFMSCVGSEIAWG